MLRLSDFHGLNIIGIELGGKRGGLGGNWAISDTQEQAGTPTTQHTCVHHHVWCDVNAIRTFFIP